MALRFGNEADFNVWLRMQADTTDAEKKLNQVGQAANEMTVDQFKQMQAQQASMLGSAKEIERATSQIQRNWWRTQRVLRASAYIFRDITIAGTALWAPIVAGAVSYAKEIEKIDNYSEATADAWMKQTRQLENAKLRIGRVSAQVLLPYLEDVTRLANQAAGFIEQHPGLLEAALKTGVAVTTVGVLGTIVTQGIKLVVDLKFVSASATIALAARNMDAAADKMLLASTGQKIGATGNTTGILAKISGTAVAGTTVGTIGGVAGGITALLGANVGLSKIFDTLYDWSEKAGPIGEVTSSVFRSIEDSLSLSVFFGAVPAIRDIKEGIADWKPVFQALTEGSKKGAEGVVSFTQDLERLKKEGEGARVILELQRSLAESAKKFEADRVKVIKDGAQAALDIQNRYGDRISTAFETMMDNIASITADYELKESREYEDYLHDRQEIVKDSNKQAVKEEQDFRDKMRKLRRDHLEKVDELVRARDALGLVKENRRYQNEVSDAQRERRKQLKRDRQETADRLAELDYRYNLERRRRYEDYQRRIQEEQARFEEEQKLAGEQRKEELDALQKSQKEKLDALQKAYDEEKRQAVNAAYEKVVLLRGAYDAELRLRQQYAGLILQSTYDFLSQMVDTYNMTFSQLQTDPTGTNSGITGSSGATPYQSGGYSGRGGLAFLHAGEYVLNPSVTKAAENAIGGKLSNKSIMAALQGQGGVNFNISFPGGFVTRHQLASAMKTERAAILDELERILA